MADTLEEVRKHVEELIRRLSEAELKADSEPAASTPASAPMDAAALGELETNVNSLGVKVDQAGNLLAQVTDLLESQAERLETLELQVGDEQPPWGGEPSAAVESTTAQPPAASTDEPSPAITEAIAALREDIAALSGELRGRVHDADARLHDLDARLFDLGARFEDMRELAWQQRSEIRTIEERFLTLAESSLRSSASGREAPTTDEIPREVPRVKIASVSPSTTESQYATTNVITAPVDVHGDADGIALVESVAQPIVTGRLAASLSEPGTVTPDARLETMDARTARRLEELVEREVRLQQEFTPGAPDRTARRTRPSVMVVDDLPDARKILSIYLSRTGYHVVTAGSAEDCLAKLRHHDVDALVLDASMPGGGGAQVCRSLREDVMYTSKRHIPVIIYTSYPEEHPPSVVSAWGATDYVVKGGDMLPLITALVKHTGEQPEPLS